MLETERLGCALARLLLVIGARASRILAPVIGADTPAAQLRFEEVRLVALLDLRSQAHGMTFRRRGFRIGSAKLRRMRIVRLRARHEHRQQIDIGIGVLRDRAVLSIFAMLATMFGSLFRAPILGALVLR